MPAATRPAPAKSPAPVRSPSPVKSPESRSAPDAKLKPDSEILFQTYFKSVGPRTYAAQVKKAGNGNHFIVLTEGKRDEGKDEIRKTRLYVFSEDFPEFFKMLHNLATFVRQNPVPEEIKQKRARFWAKQDGKSGGRP